MSTIKARLNKFDNLRGLAILMIVLWHMDVVGSLNPYFNKIVIFASLPVFFFVSGYFSKIAPDQPIKGFRRLVIPFIVFLLITSVILHFTRGSAIFIPNMFFKKTSVYWFLMALFVMKMMLPIVDKFRYPLITAIILLILCGFLNMEDNTLGLIRGLGYFPEFLLGFYYNDYKNKLQTGYTKSVELFKKHSKLITILALLFIAIVPLVITESHVYLFKIGYKSQLIKGPIKRMMILASEMLVVLLLNRYMTNAKNFLTTFGINSMAVYILHYYVVILLFKPAFSDIFGKNKLLFLPVLFISTFVVTYILSRDVVAKYFNKFTDFFYYLVVKRDEADRPQT